MHCEATRIPRLSSCAPPARSGGNYRLKEPDRRDAGTPTLGLARRAAPLTPRRRLVEGTGEWLCGACPQPPHRASATPRTRTPRTRIAADSGARSQVPEPVGTPSRRAVGARQSARRWSVGPMVVNRAGRFRRAASCAPWATSPIVPPSSPRLGRCPCRNSVTIPPRSGSTRKSMSWPARRFLPRRRPGPSEPSTRGRRELVGTIAYQFPFEHGSGNEFRLDLALRPGHHPTRGRRATPRTPKRPPARWINQHEPPRMR